MDLIVIALSSSSINSWRQLTIFIAKTLCTETLSLRTCSLAPRPTSWRFAISDLQGICRTRKTSIHQAIRAQTMVMRRIVRSLLITWPQGGTDLQSCFWSQRIFPTAKKLTSGQLAALWENSWMDSHSFQETARSTSFSWSRKCWDLSRTFYRMSLTETQGIRVLSSQTSLTQKPLRLVMPLWWTTLKSTSW